MGAGATKFFAKPPDIFKIDADIKVAIHHNDGQKAA
jgi:hypothetical protein